MRKNMLVLALTLGILFTTATAAFAYNFSYPGDRKYTGNSTECVNCHTTADRINAFGPHGGYTTSTNKCQTCHSVHAASNAALLPGATVTEACNYCHDLTGASRGAYNLTGITTSDVKAAHRVAGIAGWTAVQSIPGGDSTNGGATVLDATYQGKLSGVYFTCDSCHTPHAGAGGTVNSYLGESALKRTTVDTATKYYVTNRLLKNRPNGISTPVTEYGTAWCAACHAGRDNMGSVFNHPVDENAKAYRYLDDVAYQNGSNAAKVQSQGYLLVEDGSDTADAWTFGFSNKKYRMTANDPLTGVARDTDGYLNYGDYDGGLGPSCQQCHASPRDVDKTFANSAGKPQRYTFPHLSTNPSLLVEGGDDFCTNCHDQNLLP